MHDDRGGGVAQGGGQLGRLRHQPSKTWGLIVQGILWGACCSMEVVVQHDAKRPSACRAISSGMGAQRVRVLTKAAHRHIFSPSGRDANAARGEHTAQKSVRVTLHHVCYTVLQRRSRSNAG